MATLPAFRSDDLAMTTRHRRPPASEGVPHASPTVPRLSSDRGDSDLIGPAPPAGPGWYESSWELHRGLLVHEDAPGVERPIPP